MVLAAGGSTRMGGPTKLLLPVGGRPLVRWVVRAALAAGFEEVGVVLGHDPDRVRGALEGLPVRRIDNPDFAAGLSTSLRRGLEWASERADAALVLLGDEPGVEPAVIGRVLAEWRRRPYGACRARYLDRIGHPVVIGLPLAAPPEGDCGLGGRSGVEGGMREVDIDRPAPADIDTPEDYREALARVPR